MTPGPPPVPGGRAPEEREAARREREARRAKRKGGKAKAEPADGDGAVRRSRLPRQAGKGDGRAASDGRTARDGRAVGDGRPASDGRSATDGRPASEGRAAGDGRAAADGRASARAARQAAKDERKAAKARDRAAVRASRQAEKEERRAARDAFKAREDAKKAAEKERKAPAKSSAKPEPAAQAKATQPKPAAQPTSAKQPRRLGRGARSEPSAPAGESWRDRAQRLTAGRVKPAREPRRATATGHGGRRRLVLGLGLGAAAVGLVALWFVFSLFQPLAGDGRGEGRVSVRVPAGAGVGSIADLLEKRGVVGSAFFFQTRTRLSGRAGDLKPGAYTMAEGMSIGTALDTLTKGPAPNVVNVTVPEGRSRREVSRIIPSELEGNYLSATKRSRLLNPTRYGAPRGSSLEGFLFPSTYEVKKGRPVNVLVAEQLTAFKKQFRTVDLGGSKRANLTPYEVLTIASMIEREAQHPRERALVASVIYNRLRDGIPLGIDATVRYVTNNWSRPLTQSQLQVQSPYNTRTNKGLPPGPIGSPGIESIRAAAKPARTGYLFYVVKPGTCGEHAFSKTNAEFEADVARYNRERQRRGGKSPTKC